MRIATDKSSVICANTITVCQEDSTVWPGLRSAGNNMALEQKSDHMFSSPVSLKIKLGTS